MKEDSKLTINVLANDHDADNDTLTISSASSAEGTVEVNKDNTITFQPTSDFNGIADITYITLDGHGGLTSGTAVITVYSVNDLPVATDDTTSTTEDTLVIVDVLGNDFDLDKDNLIITKASSTKGLVSINEDNTLTFIPSENINDSATLNYTISDTKGGNASAEVAVSIVAVNDSPILANDTVQTDEDTPVIINVLNNDIDPDNDTLIVSEVHTTNDGGMVSLNRDSTLTFVPVSDFNGEVTLSYTVSDSKGGSATASVTVIINPVNDFPVLADHKTTTNQATEITINALIDAYDADGDTLKIISSSALNGEISINNDQSITYYPTTNFNGEDTISYAVTDGKGGSSNALISIFVNPVKENYSIDLNWETPTKRDDGSPLYPSDIKGYNIAYGIDSKQLDSSAFITGAWSNHHAINDLNSGIYYFAIATVTQDNIQGDYSAQIAIPINQ